MTAPGDFADVPERYRGVWRRNQLDIPGLRDTTTWARWLQTARWHADLRVPDAAQTFVALKHRKILVKNVSALHQLLANCLRLTVGTPDENRQLLTALQDSL